MHLQAAHSQELGARPARGTTMGSSFSGSHGDIFEHLPRELRITVEEAGGQDHTYSVHEVGVQGLAAGQTSQAALHRHAL